MITTVTLNAAIDKTYELPSFRIDQLNRTQSVWAEPGGKGINVAKVLQVLGAPVVVSGIVGGYNGEQICSMLNKIDLPHDFVRVADESRICLNLIDRRTGGQTEILESGPEIDQETWESLKRKLLELSLESEYIVLSGSLPRGLSQDAYAELVTMLNVHTRVVLDTSGPALEKAIAAKPFMIKPNRDELASILNTDIVNESEVIETLRKWQDLDIPIVVVSLGSQGALASVSGKIYRVVSPKISAVNPVGSGDAFTAGIVAGLNEGLDIRATLILAAAAGAANALEKRAGFVSLRRLECFKNQVEIHEIQK